MQDLTPEFSPPSIQPPKYFITLTDVLSLIARAKSKNLLDLEILNNWLKLKSGYIGEVDFSLTMLERAKIYIDKMDRNNLRDFLLTYKTSIEPEDTTKELILMLMYFVSLEKYRELFSFKPIVSMDELVIIYNKIDKLCNNLS